MLNLSFTDTISAAVSPERTRWQASQPVHLKILRNFFTMVNGGRPSAEAAAISQAQPAMSRQIRWR